jgi:predicted glycoside hydrolase/deacetylase ChbG (UPF0249 family)
MVGLCRGAILASLSTLKVRPITRAGFFHSERFAGIAESGHLNEGSLLHLLETLQPGVTEIMLHPGYRDSIIGRWPMSQRYEREQELRALTSPKVKATVRKLHIQLVDYPTLLELGYSQLGP